MATGICPCTARRPRSSAPTCARPCETIEAITGRRPIGYRAPAFSITKDSRWAYDVLVREGFAYDSSQHDSPAIRGRVAPPEATPHALDLTGGTLWEFPVAVWRTAVGAVPVGGASYWAVMPTGLVLRGLRAVGPLGGLYLHPYELDPRAPAPGAPCRDAAGATASAARSAARSATWPAAERRGCSERSLGATD